MNIIYTYIQFHVYSIISNPSSENVIVTIIKHLYGLNTEQKHAIYTAHHVCLLNIQISKINLIIIYKTIQTHI